MKTEPAYFNFISPSSTGKKIQNLLSELTVALSLSNNDEGYLRLLLFLYLFPFSFSLMVSLVPYPHPHSLISEFPSLPNAKPHTPKFLYPKSQILVGL